MYGFRGKILHVNLSSGDIQIEQPDETFYRTYWGGSAMGMYYLLQKTPPKTDPLGPENTLCFMLSAATGAPISGQSRATATAKSPLTGLAGDGQAGGFWPAELKFADFDGIVITGKAESPVYLWIHDGDAELRDAAHLWGTVTGECEQLIREELGDKKIEVAQIGPAGERLVRYASIVNMSNRAHGRTGLGAVMGSKNLKAIAVRGHNKIRVADQKALIKLARMGAKGISSNDDVLSLQKYGTAGGVAPLQASGGLPSYNFTTGVFDDFEELSGEKMAETILIGNDTCYACAVRCKRVVETEYRKRGVEPFYGGPEYETIATFGNYCGVSDLDAIALANQICNENALDSISCGATIAFAMECFERGLLTLEDTDGIELRFGNTDAMLTILEAIIKREGIGDLLAEGSARAAVAIGNGAEDLVMAVKKQELPAHMPQTKRSLGLIYAVNPFGADHESSEHDPVYEPSRTGHTSLAHKRLAQLGLDRPQNSQAMNFEKVKFAAVTQFNFSFTDVADLCQFVWGPAWQLYGPEEQVALLQSVTGWDVTLDEIQTVGERRINMMRVFNAREGADRELDTLPKRLFKQPLKGGPSDGVTIPRQEFEEALEKYYRFVGWDVQTGFPTTEKLAELGLEWSIDVELG